MVRELFELEMNVTGVPWSDTRVFISTPPPLPFKKGHNSFGIMAFLWDFFS